MSIPSSSAFLWGSVEVSILPNGVSTFTLSPFWETLALLAMRYPMMPIVATPSTPIRTMTPTMTSTIFSALLLPVDGGGPGAIACGVAGPPVIPAPHLPQNFVPSASCAPQELQKAMVHLAGCRTGEYNPDCELSKFQS